MQDKYFKRIVINILKRIGLDAEEILSQNGVKTPDIKASHRGECFIIELKTKNDNLEEIEHEEKILKEGEIIEKETLTGPGNKLYGIISDGVKQIVDYDPKHNAFHIIWLHSLGRNHSLHNRRFHATLFGTQELVSKQRKAGVMCYYFNESSFFRHRNKLDGAILYHGDTLQLCANTLSPAYQSFKQSIIYKALSAGLCDPNILEERGAMIADCNFDRKDESKVIGYLIKKYSLTNLHTIDFKQYSAKISLPKISEKRPN